MPDPHWGPFAPGLPTAERVARLRALRVIARLLCGARAADLCRHLAEAEDDAAALSRAAEALANLAPLDRRRVLAAYGGLGR